MNEPFTCPGCQVELNPGDLVCIRCGQPIKPKLNWWVDISLLLAGPCLTFLAAVLDCSADVAVAFVLLPPIPLGLVLGYRIARRSTVNNGIGAFVTVILGGVFAGLILYLSMLGCSYGGITIG